jgi:hypothetical protein
MNTVLCIALFAAGHLMRDGSPPLHSTHLARALGAFFCLAGASAVLAPWPAVLIGLAILAGFYTDQKHGEGQQARGWTDAAYLALSGVTSLAPLDLVVWAVTGNGFPIAIVGLAKPPIWFLCRYIGPDRFWAPAYPTRVAATVFGAVIGLVIALTA